MNWWWFLGVIIAALIGAILFIAGYGWVKEQAPTWAARRRNQRAARDAQRQQAAVAQSQRDEPALLDAQDLPVVPLRALASALNIAVIGPKESGKTTTLHALLRLREGYALALDPHDEPRKWPCATVGGGLEYEAIHAHMLAAYQTMRARYGAASKGERSQASYQVDAWRMSLVGDEWGGISKELPDVRSSNTPGAGRLLGKLLAQGRKVGIGVLVAAHDDTAAQLGLTGEMGLVGCFDYLIYLGGQATGNTSIPVEVRQAARKMRWPAVVQDTTNKAWGLVTVDTPTGAVAPLRAALVAPSDYEAALETVYKVGGIEQPVSTQDGRSAPVFSVIPPIPGNTDTGNTGGPNATLTPEAIRALADQGWSKNRIAALFNKSKNVALSIINEALEQTEQAA